MTQQKDIQVSDKDVMKLALEALERIDEVYMSIPLFAEEAATALRQAIEQTQKQSVSVEPVAWISWNRVSGKSELNYHKVSSQHDATLWSHFPLYTSPPQRQPLTDEHPLMVFAKECVLGAYSKTELADAAKRAIKAAHGIKEKNT